MGTPVLCDRAAYLSWFGPLLFVVSGERAFAVLQNLSYVSFSNRSILALKDGIVTSDGFNLTNK